MTSRFSQNQSSINSTGVFAYHMNQSRKLASGSGCVQFYQPILAPKKQGPPAPSASGMHYGNDDVTTNACRWGDDLAGNANPLNVGTRVRRGCNEGTNFYKHQYDPLICERPYRLHSNSVIGTGSRNAVKDSLHYALTGRMSPFNPKK